MVAAESSSRTEPRPQGAVYTRIVKNARQLLGIVTFPRANPIPPRRPNDNLNRSPFGPTHRRRTEREKVPVLQILRHTLKYRPNLSRVSDHKRRATRRLRNPREHFQILGMSQ